LLINRAVKASFSTHALTR